MKGLVMGVVVAGLVGKVFAVNRGLFRHGDAVGEGQVVLLRGTCLQPV
jgi:hypothetical protein